MTEEQKADFDEWAPCYHANCVPWLERYKQLANDRCYDNALFRHLHQIFKRASNTFFREELWNHETALEEAVELEAKEEARREAVWCGNGDDDEGEKND